MASTHRIVFTIRGLSCASCAMDVGRALRRIPGVKVININYIIDKGYVEFDPEKTSWDEVSQALTDRGFRAVKAR